MGRTSIQKVEPALLVRDYTLYPRTTLDISHVSVIYESLLAGTKFPPLIVEKDTLRVVDGFHRLECYLRYVDNIKSNTTVNVDFRKYPTDKEFYLDAIRYNSSHGKNIEGSARVGAIIKGTDLGISPKFLAVALKVRIENIEHIIKTRVANVDMRKPNTIGKPTVHYLSGRTKYQGNQNSGNTSQLGDRIALKSSFNFLRRGLEENEQVMVTPDQAIVIDSYSGQNHLVLINQICDLIEVDLIDRENEEVMTSIQKLKNILNKKY